MRPTAALAAVALTAAGASCERSRETNAEGRTESPPRRDAATVVDGGAGVSVPRAVQLDARVPMGGEQSAAWRKTLDELIRRLDRGEPLERVAAVLGTVTKGDDGHLVIESTLPWATSARLSLHGDRIFFDFNTHMLGAVVNGAVGPCHFSILLGDFGDGQGVGCPMIKTRRGTMSLNGTTEEWNEHPLDEALVDTFAFQWLPAP